MSRISISGSNAISGLSGNDTNFDKVLEQLKKIESTQLNRLEAWKGDWNMRYEAFTKIIDQVRAASNMLAKLGDKNNFVTKDVVSSDSNIITAVANASAQDVQHSITVSQVASNSVWANTGHVFTGKDDVINTTGTDQYFSFNYAGKDHKIKVPNGTTLESFASMVNNSTDNPGITVSLIQTGSGYVFQVAGKDTGVANNLVIYDSKLVGMDSAGKKSSWITNNAINPQDTLTNPTEYVYDLVLDDGTKKSITLKGNATKDELVQALNNAAGTGVINARVEGGQLKMDGVKSFHRRKSDATSTPPSTVLKVGGDIAKETLKGDLTVTINMDDGVSHGTRNVTIKAGTTWKDALLQIGQASGAGSVNLGLGANKWEMNLENVSDVNIQFADPADQAVFEKVQVPGAMGDDQGGKIAASTTTLSIGQGQLGKQLSDAQPPVTFEYTVVTLAADGKTQQTRKISMQSNQTYGDLVNKLQQEGYAVTDDGSGGKSINLGAMSTGFYVSSGFGGGMDGVAVSTKTQMQVAENSAFVTNPDGTQTLETAPELEYTFMTNNGETGTLKLPSGSSMQDVLKAIQSGTGIQWTDAGGSPIGAPADGWKVSFTDASGTAYTESLDQLVQGGKPIYLQVENLKSSSGPGISGQVSQSDNWSIQRSANARYKVDNWPMEMESSSNKVTDVIEGVVFDIQKVGEARITVSTDITSVEQSIQDFLDSVNSVLLTIRELTAYDENKEVTSNDPADIGSENYNPSGLTNQKGGILQGNYGVQLFKSRFSTLLGTPPPGFMSRQTADNILSGDVLASLANLGIKTDTNESSETYGLLVLAPSSGIAELQNMDKENYNDMITNHLGAVVDFFCASGTGSSTSADFRYSSHIDGITKAGNYAVEYEVVQGANGPEIINVTVGGKPAYRDNSMPGYYFSVGEGDPRGLAITIDDLTIGKHPPVGQEPMYVRIKQGLVQTVNGFLKDELVFNDVQVSEGMSQEQINDVMALKAKNGALMSLRDNYMTVMENIDKKIEREQYRISVWEERQKRIFANLETLLKQYADQQKSLESQINQLAGGK